jgi:hypothetical protein
MAATYAFGDPVTAPSDFSSFSKQDIQADSSIQGLLQLEPIPPARSTYPMDLAEVLGAVAIGNIANAGKITLNIIGDTGGIGRPQFQQAVAGAMISEPTSQSVAFCYHVGDVVYYFGQEQFYYEQFYDVYRNYNAPIFAIPGNHDGVVFSGEIAHSLDPFVENFCSPTPVHNPDALGAVRTTMTQPGVYFTLNAPFVKFIGLYSNVSEHYQEGVIASPALGHSQLDFLNQQLAAAKAERASGNSRALIIATHHPPFTASPDHVPSVSMLSMIDTACETNGIWPDMHISGHAHLYERYTRTVHGREIPYLVAGMSGFYNLAGLKPGAIPNAIKPASGRDSAGNPLSLNCYNDNTFGFMRVTVSATAISAEFVTVDTNSGATGVGDSFTLNLQTGTVINASATARMTQARTKPSSRSKKSRGAGRKRR